MGKRISEDHSPMSLDIKNTYFYNHQAVQQISKTFADENESKSPWYDNLWVQTCGHEMHLDCFPGHMINIMKSAQLRLPEAKRKKLHEREFWCPVCRQLCNAVLPSFQKPPIIGPFEKIPLITYGSIVSLISRSIKENINEQMSFTLENLAQVVNVDYMDLAFFANLLRNNIELFLMNKEILENETKDENFFPLKRLFKKVPTAILYNLCNNAADSRDESFIINMLKVLDPYAGSQEDISESDGIEDNIALIDIKQYLVATVIYISRPSPELIRGVICFFVNLYLLQLISWLVMGAEEEEINNWIIEENLPGTQLEFIINEIFHLNCGRIEKITHEPFSLTLTYRLKDFLKFCTILYNSVTNSYHHQDLESYELWEFYHILFDTTAYNISSLKCFGWDEDIIVLYVRRFARQINRLMSSDKAFHICKKLNLCIWKHPKLMSLPMCFNDIARKFLQLTNYKDLDHELNFTFICLVCCEVEILTKKDFKENRKQIFAHVEHCGRGTCIFLQPTENYIFIYFDKRSHLWDSIYIDEHGESNIKLKSFKNMYLSEVRLHMLENMWLFNSFDVFSKFWADTLS